MKFKILLPFLTVLSTTATVQGCTSEYWGQGTCEYPPATVSGNGAPLTEDIVHSLATCFINNFGAGPYVLDGIGDLPDAGGFGVSWGVHGSFDGVSLIPFIPLL